MAMSERRTAGQADKIEQLLRNVLIYTTTHKEQLETQALSVDTESSDTRTFRIPFTKTKTFGQRAFSFTGPTEWNSLPYDVRNSVSTSTFKQALKTHLFRSAYN